MAGRAHVVFMRCVYHMPRLSNANKFAIETETDDG